MNAGNRQRSEQSHAAVTAAQDASEEEEEFDLLTLPKLTASAAPLSSAPPSALPNLIIVCVLPMNSYHVTYRVCLGPRCRSSLHGRGVGLFACIRGVVNVVGGSSCSPR